MSREIDVAALLNLPDAPGKDDEIGPHGPAGERCEHVRVNERKRNGVVVADCERCEATIYGAPGAGR